MNTRGRNWKRRPFLGLWQRAIFNGQVRFLSVPPMQTVLGVERVKLSEAVEYLNAAIRCHGDIEFMVTVEDDMGPEDRAITRADFTVKHELTNGNNIPRLFIEPE